MKLLFLRGAGGGVSGSWLTVSGSRPNNGGTTKPKCVTSLARQVVTHETRATTGLERMCDMCDMCDTFFKFLLENISKHMIISERTFALKSCHTCHTSVELLYTLTFSCGTLVTKMSHKCHQPSLSVTQHQIGAFLSLITRTVNHNS